MIQGLNFQNELAFLDAILVEVGILDSAKYVSTNFLGQNYEIVDLIESDFLTVAGKAISYIVRSGGVFTVLVRIESHDLDQIPEIFRELEDISLPPRAKPYSRREMTDGLFAALVDKQLSACVIWVKHVTEDDREMAYVLVFKGSNIKPAAVLEMRCGKGITDLKKFEVTTSLTVSCSELNL